MNKFKKIIWNLVFILFIIISAILHYFLIFCGMGGPGYDPGLVCNFLTHGITSIFLFVFHIFLLGLTVIDIIYVIFNSRNRTLLSGKKISLLISILVFSLFFFFFGILFTSPRAEYNNYDNTDNYTPNSYYDF